MCLSTHRRPPPPRERVLGAVCRVRVLGSVSLALAALTAQSALAEPCSLHRIVEIPVTMESLVPTVQAKVNGRDAVFVADSGAFFSTITTSAAEMLHLSLSHSPIQVVGVGGVSRTYMATVDKFSLAGMEFSKVPFLVAGSDFGPGVVGLLGQNLFRAGDVEYDLANGVIRLLHPQGDCKKASLAYWANAKGQSYSVIEIDFATVGEPHTKSVVYVNGQRLRATFDTGAHVSVLTREAAQRAGFATNTPGVVPGGEWSGMGSRVGKSLIVPFESFKIGDEEVQHARLRVADLSLQGGDMLIGADFFLSHHVLVASSQRRLYFTYNGGPVFNLSAAPGASPPAAEGGASPLPDAPAAAAAAAAEGLDAAGYARRGAAETSRHDYEHAVADLTRACELAPTEADYFYERGMAYWHLHNGEAALADFDQAIKLKPEHVPALVGRARLRSQRRDADELILVDLDSADRVAPREDQVRLSLATLYMEAGNSTASIAQFTKFIDSHDREDTEMGRALNGRCWARALAGRELEQALDDCDRAVRRRPEEASFHDSRGLVHLRMGHYDKAIGDYDTALRLNPKIAWSLYGRGIAKLRKGDGPGGQADISAATALEPKIAAHAARYDIKP